MTFYLDKQKVLTLNDLNKNSYIALFDSIILEHKVITSWSSKAILTNKVYPVMEKNIQMIFLFLYFSILPFFYLEFPRIRSDL